VEERSGKASDALQTVKDFLRAPEGSGSLRASPRTVSHEQARRLVLAHGWNATAYQILNPGIELWFSPDNAGVVGFVRYGGTRVVAGAPVCDFSRLDEIAARFLDDSHRNGERVCYFGAGDRLDARFSNDPQWSRVLLGAQPVWDPHRWPGAIARRPSLRAQFNRARNKAVQISEWPASQAENHPVLRRCLAEWLESRNLPPLHFLVEPETLSNLADRRVFVALRGGAEVIAFTVLSPVPARNGWLVEQIVRGRAAPNGTAELLLDFAVKTVASTGSTYVTLGLSPLSQRANIAPVKQPLWLTLVLRWVRLHGSRFYNFRGLDAFKAKFNPEDWEPIYAISEGRTFAPRALYAIAGAFGGGNPVRLIAIAVLRAIRAELGRIAGRLRFAR
jgi:phosphatidylglycerol lysyltransferase